MNSELSHADEVFVRKVYQQSTDEMPDRQLDSSILAMAKQNTGSINEGIKTAAQSSKAKPIFGTVATVIVFAALFWQYQDIFSPEYDPEFSATEPMPQILLPTTDELVYQDRKLITQLRSREVALAADLGDTSAPAFDDVIDQLQDAPDDVNSLLESEENLTYDLSLIHI